MLPASRKFIEIGFATTKQSFLGLLAQLSCRAVIVVVALVVTCFHVLAADLDSIREPIVRPNTETLKKWLYGQEIVLEKRTLWFDRTEKLDPGKWAKLSAQGGSVVAKTVGTNIATSIWSFEYPDGKGRTNKYVVAVEYEWTLRLGSIDRVFLKAIITGP